MVQSRTHTCNDLRIEHVGQQVKLVGWMENIREVGQNLAFVVLRDFYGTTQIVLESEEMMAAVKGLNKESTLSVEGVVRGVREYGVFIELAPNLSGLADWRGDLEPGDRVSVYIKSIRPENRTIKISELNLHWIGILLLCLSTLSTAVIQRGMLRLDGASPAEMEQIMASGATAQWAVQAMLLTMTATLALPLYAKLLVEAVDQTEDKRRLLLELGGCALASEVPYDWAMSGKLWNGGVQNPAWGLLTGPS